MGRFFGWKLRKHINIPNFYRGQYHQTIFHDTYFSDCIFFFICWQKSSILRISSKKFLSSKVFKDFSKSRRIFVFVFGLFSKPEDYSSSSSVHFWSSLQHCFTWKHLNPYVHFETYHIWSFLHVFSDWPVPWPPDSPRLIVV